MHSLFTTRAGSPGRRGRLRRRALTALTAAAGLALTAAPAYATNTWTSQTSMSAGRYNHTSTLLDGPACRGTTPPAYCGKVLVTGGEGTYVSTGILTPTAPASSLNSTALYNPGTNSWTAGPNMNSVRSRHTATLLDGPPCQGASPPSYCGKVLVAGGANDKYSADFGLNSVELYDPASGTVGSWTSKAPMALPHHLHTATLLNDNRVLVAGGFPYPHAAQVYDPATDTWNTTGPATAPVAVGPAYQTAFGHARHSATLVDGGRVLVVGGCVLGFLNAPACSAELYNPATNGWTQETPPVLSTFNHTATRLVDANGQVQVLVAGGSFVRGLSSSDGNAEATTDRAELFTPGTPGSLGTWSLTDNLMNSPRARHTATELNNGLVLVAGGKNDSHDLSDPVDTSELYDPTTRTWSPTSMATMQSRRAAHAATLLANGEVFVTGGFASGVPHPVIPLNAYLTGFTPINSTERYAP